MNAAELTPFKQLIKSRCGLQLEGVGEQPLVSAIAKRMAVHRLALAPVYFTRLVAQDDEFQEFVSLLTINETYFFREPEQLTLLVERLVPRLLAEQGGRLPIRILSAGCSTGEEPYSIAMALLERFGESAPRLVQILGGDIDHHALAKARAGNYGTFSFRSLRPELRQRYFRVRPDGGMSVDDRVRAMVAFHPLNLLADSLPAALRDIDIVFFRNVSIYFDEATRRTIHHTLYHAMSERGLLVIGSAETLANDLGVFRLVEEDGAFYFRKGAAAEPPPVAMAPPPAPRVVPPPPPSAVAISAIPAQAIPAQAEIGIEEAKALIRDKRFDRVDLLLSPRNRRPPANAALLALEGYARLANRDFTAAAELGNRALGADEWSMDALMLLGLAAKHRGDGAEALRWFKQAVYVRQDCWPAQYYLADQQRAAGATTLAQRGYRAALTHMAAHPDPDGGLSLPLGLPMAEVRFLCERHCAAAPPTAARS